MLRFNTFHYFDPSEIFKQNNKSELLEIVSNENIRDNMFRLLRLLEAFRTLFFDEPIYITSFYRDKKHNKKVGGVANSFHLLGAAVDVTTSNIPALLAELSEHSELVKAIHYPDKNFIHIQLNDPKK